MFVVSKLVAIDIEISSSQQWQGNSVISAAVCSFLFSLLSLQGAYKQAPPESRF
jgi:hypothetical protein